MDKKWVTILIAVGVGIVLTFFVGCESDAQTGAGVGALAGAGIGQLAGGDTESTLVGAAVGGGAGSERVRAKRPFHRRNTFGCGGNGRHQPERGPDDKRLN